MAKSSVKHMKIAATAGARRSPVLCLLLVFAGFALTSSGYLAWLYHLIGFAGSDADALSMVGGYSLQALGIGAIVLLARRWPGVFDRVPFIAILALHCCCAVPAALGTTFASTLVFGYLMNFLCGAIAASYLHRLASSVRANHRGLVFGGGYACSVVASYLVSLVPGFQESGTFASLIPCLAFSVIAAIIVLLPTSSHNTGSSTESTAPNVIASASAFDGERGMRDARIRIDRRFIAFSCISIMLMSLVKNVGFGFPAADVSAGLSIEVSRLTYAAGLIIAGILIDRSRKYGILCCLVALITPFAVLAIANEPVSSMAMWMLDYFFFGFFSVFRVILFADIASSTGSLYLAGLGLMFGRLGDALGTAVYLSLGTSTIALVALAGVLFAATVIVFLRLFQPLFQTAAAPEPAPKSENELFEEFCARYELSSREREVLQLLLQGERSNAEIAAELFVTEGTVKFHIRNLLRKTGCKNRRELRATYTRSRAS